MQKDKIISILVILGLLGSFCIFDIVRKSEKAVVNIISPTIIELEDEIICISDVETFTSDLGKNQSELEKKYNINHENAVKFGYLADKFADSFLSNKTVKVKYNGEKDSNCKYGDIIVNKQSYKSQLTNSGFNLKEDFSFNLAKAKKLKLVILNHKSSKYHTLDCKYGNIAHDIILLPEKQLPKEAKPCKFCHVHKVEQPKTYPLAISNGNIKMYLTDFTLTLKPDNKCTSLVCKELLSLINSAENSIDIALYGYGQVPAIYNALQNAKQRGVKIRIAYDISKNNYYPETKMLLQLANEKTGDNPQILMHNKFFIFDDKKLFTGSMNFSPTGLSGFNSNCVFSINSQDIARIYKAEFEQMLNGKFHGNKSKVLTKTIKLTDAKVTPLFSPKDKVITNNIVPLIDKAKHYIYIPAFIITHDEFTNALIRAHKRGVTVKIIVDATNSYKPRSKTKLLRDAGLPVKIENYAGKMHSKTIIIDDKYLIAGSMNFSNSGENKNDENCLIIESERFARYYREFFEYLWKKIPDKYLKLYVRAEGKDSIGSCSDGIDNNYDGKIDMQDEACL